MSSNFPVTTIDDLLPVGSPTAPTSEMGERDRQRTARAIAMMKNLDPGSVDAQLAAGDRTVLSEARVQFNPDPSNTYAPMMEEGYRYEVDPGRTAELFVSETTKMEDWHSVGDQFYLEHALSFGDPSISDGTVRFATNMTVAQTMLQEAIGGEIEEAGWLKYNRLFGDFVDRYVYRAMPIGGIEAIFNRPERLGNELVAAAATMGPQEFEAFFHNKMGEWRSEGILSSDNIFALKDALYALTTAGEDEWEWFNRSFGVLDVVGAGQVVKGSVKGILKAGTALQTVAHLKDADVAADMAEQLIRKGDAQAHLDLQPQVLDPNMAPVVRPRTGKLAEIYEENKLLREVTEYTNTGALGRSTRSVEVRRVADDVVQQINKVSNNPIVNVRYPIRADITGNPILDINLGTLKNGKPYPNPASASSIVKKLQDAGHPTAKIVPVDPENKGKGWYINVQERLDIEKGVEAIDVSKPAFGKLRSVYASLFGSKAQLEAELLQDLAVMNEGSRDVLMHMVKPELKAIDSVNSASKKILSQVYSDLRDGPDAFVRNSYTKDEFALKFESIANRTPTDKEFEAFKAIQSVNDAAYIMAAHQKLQKYVREGYWGAVLPGESRLIPVKAASPRGLPMGTMVADVSQTGRKAIQLSQDLPANQKIWRVDGDLDGFEYVTNVPEIKVLSHTDVLGYNAGGRRINPDAKYFVTTGGSNPKALLQAFSEKQALKAVDDLEAIRLRVAAHGGTDLAKGTPELDEFVRAHNAWNPSITTLDDFTKWAGDKKLNLSQPITYKARDAVIKGDEVTYGLNDTWGEHFTHTLHRYDDAIPAYGGVEARQRDPITAIFEDFSSQAAQFSHSIYNQTAITSWVKAASKKGSGWSVPRHSDPRRQFELAVRDGADRSAGAAQLDYQKEIISQRIKMNGEYGKRMAKLGNAVQEYVFDVSKGKVKMGDNLAQGAESKMLGLGFQSVFGFFAPAQFIIQGSHIANIVGIAPRFGAQAGMMAIPLRLAMLGGDHTVEAIAKSRYARFLGWTDSEMDEVMEFIRQSGRQYIESSAIQKGVDRTWGASGWKGESWRSNDFMATLSEGTVKALDASSIFFREGEGMARMTAQLTAIMEYRAANKGASLFTDHARRTISRREQALSFRMTNTNRATIQQGLGKLPTQWWSFTMRSLENIVLGRDFTKAERVRMAFMLTGFYGLTGLGLKSAADYLGESLGAEPGGIMHTAITRGVWDSLIQGLTGAEIDLAGRMAPITLLTDLYKDVVTGDKSAIEVALGPSYDISKGFAGPLWQALGDIAGGRPRSLTEDVIRALRGITQVDNVYKAWSIVETGAYRSRTGRLFPGELSSTDAIAQLMGFSPREVSDFYERGMRQNKGKEKRSQFSRRLQADITLAWEHIREGRRDRGYALMNEIGLAIDFSGFSEYDKQIIRRSVFENLDTNEIVKLIEREYQLENPYGADVVEEQMTIPGTGGN